MDEKITYYSDLPSARNVKIEKLTKTQAEEKFGIKWADSNIVEKDVTKAIPAGHTYVGIAEMGKNLDQDLGKGVFAIRDIPENTPLFLYGGERTKELPKNDLYLVTPIGSPELKISAKTFRNYGGYLQHGPAPKELERYGLHFLKNEVPIATQNVVLKKMPDRNEIIVVTSRNIKAGEILCYSYQDDYWINYGAKYGESPSLFTKQGNPINPNDLVCKNMLVVVTDYDDPTQSAMWQGTRNDLKIAINTKNNYLRFGPEEDHFYVSPDVLRRRLETHSEFYLFIRGQRNLNPLTIGNRFSIFSTKEQPFGPFKDAYVRSDLNFSNN